MMAEARQAVPSDSSGEGKLHREFMLGMVCKGTDLNLEETEWCPSESSGQSEVSLDAGVDLAQAIV